MDRASSRPMGSAEQDVEEAVFYQAFIPKRLDEVMHYERDHDKLQAAASGQKVEGIYYQGITGFKQDMSGPRGAPAGLSKGIPPGGAEDGTISINSPTEDKQAGSVSSPTTSRAVTPPICLHPPATLQQPVQTDLATGVPPLVSNQQGSLLRTAPGDPQSTLTSHPVQAEEAGARLGSGSDSASGSDSEEDSEDGSESDEDDSGSDFGPDGVRKDKDAIRAERKANKKEVKEANREKRKVKKPKHAKRKALKKATGGRKK